MTSNENNGVLKSTSELFTLMLERHTEPDVKLVDLLESFREAGFSVLLILFAAPIALPLPALGIAQVLATPLLFLSAQLALGFRSPWVPEKLGNKTIKRETLVKVSQMMIPYLQKVEHLLKPRIAFLSSRLGDKIIGIVCLICSISIAIPLPFTNTVPGMGIVIMSVGLLERDGIVIFAGMCVAAAGCFVTTLILFFGTEVIYRLIDFIKQLF